MTAEKIVRALAQLPAPLDTERGTCRLCGTSPRWRHNRRQVGKTEQESITSEEIAAAPDWIFDDLDGRLADMVDEHEPDCPWRLAREWAA